MKEKIKYIVLLTVLLSSLVGIIPMALAPIPPEPPPPTTKYYGTSFSFSGLFTQGTISDTYTNNGAYLTAYMWGIPVVWLFGIPIVWKYWGHLRIYFGGVKASKLAVEYYCVPYGAILKIVHTDGYSKSWSGYHGQYKEFSIDSTKGVNYVELSLDLYGGPTGSFVQFDLVYLIK
ncbi:MAG: hypothetical protein ACFE9N_00905 [Promethearchaeota archaeon]